MFFVNEMRIGVFHVGNDFFALYDRCPHAAASLAEGIIECDTVHCRIHYWRFSLRDGTYLDEDRPSANARCFPVRIVGQDVQVMV